MSKPNVRRFIAVTGLACAIAILGGTTESQAVSLPCPVVANNPCVESYKPSTTGGCATAVYRPSGTVCDDHNPCTFGETCNGGGGCGLVRPAPLSGSITCVTTPADIDACQVRACNGTATCSVSSASVGAACTPANATIAGYCDQSGACQLPKPSAIKFDKVDAKPNDSVTVIVTLSAPAPPGGLVVPMSSNSQLTTTYPYSLTMTPDARNMPVSAWPLFPNFNSVTVPAGSTTGSFKFDIVPLYYNADTDWCAWPTADATIKTCVHAHYRLFDGNTFATKFATTHSHAHKGESFTLTVNIAMAAPVNGWPVSITYTNAPVSDPTAQWYWNTCGGGPSMTGPSVVTVPQGAKSTTATINVAATSNCGDETITANSGAGGPGQLPTISVLVIDPARIQDN